MLREGDKNDNLWFAAKTIAHAELKMRDYFKKCNIECFIPSTTEFLKKNGEIYGNEIPVIKNLIFFKTTFDVVNSIFNLNNRKIYRVRNKNGLITIPEREMSTFIAFITHYSDKVEVLESDYVVGDKMMIKSGPFAGVQGSVTQVDKKNYFILKLDGVLTVAVRMPKSNLIKVAEAEKTEGCKKYCF